MSSTLDCSLHLPEAHNLTGKSLLGLIFLYSIELAWNVIKQRYRKVVTEMGLNKQDITVDNIQGCFAEATESIPRETFGKIETGNRRYIIS